MARSRDKQILKVEGRDVTVSDLEKVLYSASGFTKGAVIDCSIRVAHT